MTRRSRPPRRARIDLFEASVPVLFYAIMVTSVFLLLSGHNHPGGGFAGGTVAGAALAMRYITGGIAELRHIARLRPWTFLGLGVVLAVLAAVAPLAFGENVLESAKLEFNLPLLGHLAVSSVLDFDLGVYLVVVGLVLMVFEAFGDEDIGIAPKRPPVIAEVASQRTRSGGEVTG